MVLGQLSPGTTLLRSNDIKHRLTAAGAKLIITDSSSMNNVDLVNISTFILLLYSLVHFVIAETVVESGGKHQMSGVFFIAFSYKT
jgi:acyl-coenzyme A synthetase/AMP-(fatty) acid ligase